MREIVQSGERWLIVDVKSVTDDRQPESLIAEIIVNGLKQDGIAAEARFDIPRSSPGIMHLLIPIVRLYLPLKDTGRDFYAAAVGAISAHLMGVPADAIGTVLVPSAVTALAQRIKTLDKEELRFVTSVSTLNRQLHGPVTSVQLSSHSGRDVEGEVLRLSERGILRYTEGGWIVDF